MSRRINRKKPFVVAKYELHHCLGRGSMGKVKLAYNTENREKVAVKIVKRADCNISNKKSSGKLKTPEQMLREKEKEEIREMRTIREAHIMMLLRHPHIVQLRNLYASEANFYIVMDYVNGGQLLHYIVKKKKLPEDQARRFSRQIISALDYLHRNSIVHRDLKIENIMIDKNGWNLKIIDFGLSNLFCPERKLTTYCGSLYFAAPELLKAVPYFGPEIDVWSLGVVIYVMVAGSVPFDDRSMPGLHEKIKRGLVAYPAHVSYSCKSLLGRIFVTDPQKRITLQNIIRDEWINEGYTELIDNFLPTRIPVSEPLNARAIKCMTRGFNMGTENDIKTKLELIIQSQVYRNAAAHVNRIQFGCPSRRVADLANKPYDDPQTIPAAYHPLVALYHLTRERHSNPEYEFQLDTPIDGSQPSFYDSTISLRSENTLTHSELEIPAEEEEEDRIDDDDFRDELEHDEGFASGTGSRSDSDEEGFLGDGVSESGSSVVYGNGDYVDEGYANAKTASMESLPDAVQSSTLNNDSMPPLVHNISTTSASDASTVPEDYKFLKLKDTKHTDTTTKTSIGQFVHKSTHSIAAAFRKLSCIG